MNRKQRAKTKRRRTTWNGWRIVAGGVLLLIFGFTLFSNEMGPSWLALGLLLIGVGLVIYGRRH